MSKIKFNLWYVTKMASSSKYAFHHILFKSDFLQLKLLAAKLTDNTTISEYEKKT